MENEILEITTERMSNGPAAVGRHNGVVIFVHGAAPGETVRIQVTEKKKRYWVAKLIKVLSPSEQRVSPPCAVFGFESRSCGGCDWQHLSYTAQLKEKENTLLFEVHKATKLSIADLQKILSTHPAPEPYGYRARTQVRINSKGIGFFSRGSHAHVVASNCLVLKPELQKHWASALKDLPSKDEIIKQEWTWDSNEGLHVLTDQTDTSFTQINPEQNSILQKLISSQVLEKSTQRKTLFDLYAGNGNLSTHLASHFETTVCVESLPPKVTNTTQTWIKKSVEDFLKSKDIPERKLKPDVVIVDPPRTGISDASLVANLDAQLIVYVSCNPATLARDLGIMLSEYSLVEIHCLDFFPQTHHIESMCVLKHN